MPEPQDHDGAQVPVSAALRQPDEATGTPRSVDGSRHEAHDKAFARLAARFGQPPQSALAAVYADFYPGKPNAFESPAA